MGLDYSQKRLLSTVLHTKKNDPRSKRLRLYAFLTGIMSLLISVVQLLITALK